MYQLRQAKIEDLPAILLMIEKAKNKMANLGINQWQNGTPNREIVIQDINNTESYVLEQNGIIVASAMVSSKKEETYNFIEGKWNQNDLYTVVHRFVVDSSVTNSGIGQKMLQMIEEMSEHKYVRIDTHKDNHPMKRLLFKCNYDFCGVISLNDGSKRDAYDKILKEMKFGGVL